MPEVPKSLKFFCENCNIETGHKVVKGKITNGKKIRFKGVIKCSQCGSVREVEIAEDKPIKLTVNISSGEITKSEKVEFEPDEKLSESDEIVIYGRRGRITKIESHGRRVRTALAREVERLWVKDIEKVQVKIAVNERNITRPYILLSEPDEEFHVGEIIETEDGAVVITSIKTTRNLVKREDVLVEAEDIVRIFCRRVA
ncbi:MAG: HVO_0476 family zinc finger protein [Thermoplasmata archaeon]